MASMAYAASGRARPWRAFSTNVWRQASRLGGGRALLLDACSLHVSVGSCAVRRARRAGPMALAGRPPASGPGPARLLKTGKWRPPCRPGLRRRRARAQVDLVSAAPYEPAKRCSHRRRPALGAAGTIKRDEWKGAMRPICISRTQRLLTCLCLAPLADRSGRLAYRSALTAPRLRLDAALSRLKHGFASLRVTR